MSSRDTRPISFVAPSGPIREHSQAEDDPGQRLLAAAGFPEGAQNEIMRALTVEAEGRKADIAKPLKGFGSGVFEVALKYRTDAYRTIYALQLEERLWVLHAFQKKAKQGIKTPKRDIALIRERLKRLKKELQQ